MPSLPAELAPSAAAKMPTDAEAKEVATQLMIELSLVKTREDVEGINKFCNEHPWIKQTQFSVSRHSSAAMAMLSPVIHDGQQHADKGVISATMGFPEIVARFPWELKRGEVATLFGDSSWTFTPFVEKPASAAAVASISPSAPRVVSSPPTFMHALDFERLPIDGNSTSLTAARATWDGRESGSSAACAKAMRLAVTNGQQRPSVAHLQEYHKTSLTKVVLPSKINKRDAIAGQFRRISLGLGISVNGQKDANGNAISDERFQQIRELVEHYGLRLHMQQKDGTVRVAPLMDGEAHAVAGRIIEDCATQLDRLRQDPEKNKQAILECIANAETALMLLHPFPDGNGRAISNALVQHLLIYAGLGPILLDPVPWAMEIADRTQLVSMYEKGRKNWEDLARAAHGFPIK